MNNSTEQTMKAWQPRRPSPELRARIFVSEELATTPASAPVEFDWAGLTRWLAPAVGCFALLIGMSGNPETRLPLGSIGSISGQELAISIAAGHRDFPKNNVPSKSLEWTFGAPSSSSNDSFTGSETNTLHK